MNTGLLDFRTDRDASLKLIDWFDIERVRAARILVIGAGAIGNEVLKNLALLGIGHVFIYDKDTIDMSNLSRSVLFRATDAGALKAAVAARAIRDLNPNVEALWESGDVTLDLGLGVYRTMDVIIGCLDNREARLHVNRACWKLDRPWVDGGIGQLNGQARAYRPGHGACYECSMTENDYRRISVPCGAIASRYASEGKGPDDAHDCVHRRRGPGSGSAQAAFARRLGRTNARRPRVRLQRHGRRRELRRDARARGLPRTRPASTRVDRGTCRCDGFAHDRRRHRRGSARGARARRNR
ncbi:MAG: ThiF family adenylyltransferase [Blastocatellia bacterium]|nr:ThiF family adenylyltransferase [Blastocatellia bacterium]